jgi:hypothetical protein
VDSIVVFQYKKARTIMFDNNYLKEEKKIIRSDDNGDDNDD